MKGYKGFDNNLQCRGKQYEVGKIHHQDGKIELCGNGIHFCKDLKDVFNYYPDGRYCEIEAAGTIVGDYDKFASSDIFIIRELDAIEVNHYRYGYGDGYGCGYGGYGYGYGCGYGYGYGCGDGYGYGYGYGYGCGYGYGYDSNGYGCGYGYGDGYGCGYGYGYGDGYDGYGYGYDSNGYNIQKILIFTEV